MRSRLLPLVLALASACAFAFAVQTAWWSAGGVAIGPFGSRHCFSGDCSEGGLAFLGGADLWMRAGVAARAAGYITMFILIIVAGALAAKRVPKLMARSSIVATLTAAVTGGYFLVAFPAASLGNAESIGPGVFLFVGAVVLAFAAAVFTLRMPTPDRT
jgi:hypothetical protein